jgi:hypothetical protein
VNLNNEDDTFVIMRVAVCYTGALRTVLKTIRYFQQNVLLGPDVHVFACVQNDTTRSNAEWEAWLRTQMKGQLVSLTWFDMSQHEEWTMFREKNLACTFVPNHWKDYIRSSGSVIEYIQLFLTYRQLLRQERAHGVSYDYVIRMRPDNLFAKPVDFHWLGWSEADIDARLGRLRDHMATHSIPETPETVLQLFMGTVLDDGLMKNITNLCGEYKKSKGAVVPSTAAEYREYLHHGSYILTYRANNLYIVRRDLFHLLPSVGPMYGLLPTPSHDDYWFNAENQFQSTCYYSGLSIHDYNTLFEDKCLYDYDEKRYFDSEYHILNPFMVYCLVRN